MDGMGKSAQSGWLWRSRWAAIGAAITVAIGGGGLFLAHAAPSVASAVITIDPVRVLDTRDPGNLGLPGPFVSPVGQKLQVTGPTVPVGATGVILNVTAVGATANGFVSIRPGDATGAPSTSSLNVTAGTTVPNAVTVALPTAGANAGQIDITWDALGAAGPTTDILIDVVAYLVPSAGGVQGPQGPQGPPGPVNLRWAKVAGGTSGALLNGFGAVSTIKGVSGEYDVIFNGSVVGCGWQATRNDADSGAGPPGEIAVERADSAITNRLRIRTFNSSGVQANLGNDDAFTLTVICP